VRLREKIRQIRPGPPRLLVVTAVANEREALERGIAAAVAEHGPGTFALTVIDSGVGVASAAATAMAALSRADLFAGVVAAGIGGGIGVPAGGLALGTASVAADLGAEGQDGFSSIEQLGLGRSTLDCDPDLVASLHATLPEAVPGSILTVSTVTGTAERALAIRTRHPEAVAEAMEGFGVATAAARVDLPFAEIRAVSNPVGPRDRPSWRIPEALAALERAGAALATLVP
jgi:futalosine hydrolase